MTASETETSRRAIEVLRFAVPYDAAVAVVGDEVADIGRRVVLPLATSDSPADLTDEAAIARLEQLREQGFEFLVLGPSAYDWLTERPRLAELLRSEYRLVDSQPDACAVYALHGGSGRTGRDGLPLPPVDMIRITSGMRNAPNPDAAYRRFERGAAGSAEWIRDKLAAHGAPLEGMGALLDFGCGCGRVTRHWSGLPGDVHGTDYNPLLVGWCAANLPFAEFRVNGLEPPLPYDDSSFDFLYSISIFTHLDEPLQVPWMQELVRVLRPGGLILITVSGEQYARGLPGWDRFREQFEAGQLVVTKPERTGSNSCAVYHPPSYVRDVLTSGLEIVDHEPGVEAAGQQDGILLRTPERP
jgi:SAM-dependent methyltransferase